jgi:hypothetical protein
MRYRSFPRRGAPPYLLNIETAYLYGAVLLGYEVVAERSHGAAPSTGRAPLRGAAPHLG